MDDLIKEIALKHGVAVSRDDPVLIVHTLNERLLREGQAAQAALLDGFKSELETVSAQWSGDAKVKAERVLNAALAASKDSMAQLMSEGAKVTVEGVRAEIRTAVAKIAAESRQAQRVAYLNIIASSVTLAAAGLAVWVAFRAVAPTY